MGNTMSLKVLEAFEKKFGDAKGVHCFFAPGRVNLIGEHTDYNGGHVLPCALSIGTYAAVRVRDDRSLRFFSLNFEDEGIIEGSLDDLTYDSKKAFSNYPLAVVWALVQNGYEVPFGLDIAFFGDIPYRNFLNIDHAVILAYRTVAYIPIMSNFLYILVNIYTFHIKFLCIKSLKAR